MKNYTKLITAKLSQRKSRNKLNYNLYIAQTVLLSIPQIQIENFQIMYKYLEISIGYF